MDRHESHLRPEVDFWEGGRQPQHVILGDQSKCRQRSSTEEMTVVEKDGEINVTQDRESCLLLLDPPEENKFFDTTDSQPLSPDEEDNLIASQSSGPAIPPWTEVSLQPPQVLSNNEEQGDGLSPAVSMTRPLHPNALARRRVSPGGSFSSVSSRLVAPSVTSISTSSTITAVSHAHATAAAATSSRGRRRSSSRATTVPHGSSVTETIDEETAGGLRASLDAGMAAVRKWIRARSSSVSNNINNPQNATVSATATTAAAAAATRRRHQTTVDIDGSDDEEMGEDTAISNSTSSLDDFIAAASASSVADGGPLSPRHHFFANTTRSSTTSRLAAPPTILENHAASRNRIGGSGWGNPVLRNPRQRALSEPDAVTLRDFLFQRALTPQGGFRRRRYTSIAEPAVPPAMNANVIPFTGSNPLSQFRFSQGQRPQDIGGATMEGTPVGGAGIGTTLSAGTPSQRLSSSAVEVLYLAAPSEDSAEISTLAPSAQEDHLNQGSQHGNRQSGNTNTESNSMEGSDLDPNSDARTRWLYINRSFQVVITIVALIFSLLLFAILVCWVVLTSTFVVSIDKECDVPLKAYFWLVTLQLILDVFRTDIMRLFFRWDTNSNQRIPCRVITYNIAYLIYALAVLWLGVDSVFVQENVTCRATARSFFRSSKAFVTLSIGAWATIFLGYLLPFCLVATLLTLNGYTPANDSQRDPAAGPFTVFPTPMGAPPDCVDHLTTAQLDELPVGHSVECSICMENFTASDTIVKTVCNHLYHKHCLADWLRNARTCPVCRMDIPAALVRKEQGEEDEPSQHEQGEEHAHRDDHPQRRIGIGPVSRTFARQTDMHHEIMMMHTQIIRRTEHRSRGASPTSSSTRQLRNRSGSIEVRNRSRSHSFSQNEMMAIEEGRGR